MTNPTFQFVEAVFPVLPNDTQYELVANWDFYGDSWKRGNDLNVFSFMWTLHRSDLREFFCKVQCPLLLLNYTKFRLENEIRNSKIGPELSQIMELLYLFSDFIDQDFIWVQNMKHIKHMWNQECLERTYQSRLSKEENFGMLSSN